MSGAMTSRMPNCPSDLASDFEQATAEPALPEISERGLELLLGLNQILESLLPEFEPGGNGVYVAAQRVTVPPMRLEESLA